MPTLHRSLSDNLQIARRLLHLLPAAMVLDQSPAVSGFFLHPIIFAARKMRLDSLRCSSFSPLQIPKVYDGDAWGCSRQLVILWHSVLVGNSRWRLRS
jgi:hypothetical protein